MGGATISRRLFSSQQGYSMRFRRDPLLVALLLLLSVGLWYLPTGFEGRLPDGAVRAKARVTAVDDSGIQQHGIVKTGDQEVRMRILDGPFAGREVSALNPLLGKMDLDKIFVPGDTVLAVLTVREGEIVYVNPQDHYRLQVELLLLGCFAALLLAFAGWTGAKALLSFLFSGLMIWKVMIPSFLKGYDPVLVAVLVTAVLAAAVIFLVGGVGRRGVTAFCGTLLGIATGLVMALVFMEPFHLHGAVRPFSETLLYSGYGHLDLTGIFLASIFLACSGAVMDLAMDVAAAMDEVVRRSPGIARGEALKSGLRVGRAVVGTMTTTLLLAYSGGYMTLLMVFMAQGVPPANLFNLNYVAAEVLNTLAGSFGLVTAAPFTALVGAFVYVRPKGQDEKKPRP
jgi:uncharacterized membrane protein